MSRFFLYVQKNDSYKKQFWEKYLSVENPYGTKFGGLAPASPLGTQVPQNQIPGTSKPYENKGFGTLWFSVPELLCFPMKMKPLFVKCIILYFKIIVIYNVFRTRFPTCGK